MNKPYFKYVAASFFFYLLLPNKASKKETKSLSLPPCNGVAVRCAFIAKYYKLVVAACSGTNILPSVAMVMAIYETANGTNKLSRNANNFYGIKKGSNWAGSTYFEYDDCNGQKCEFRAYSSFSESIKDYIKLLTTSQRYALVSKAKTSSTQLDAIMAGGYASSAYAATAKQIIVQYNLTDLDAYV